MKGCIAFYAHLLQSLLMLLSTYIIKIPKKMLFIFFFYLNAVFIPISHVNAALSKTTSLQKQFQSDCITLYTYINVTDLSEADLPDLRVDVGEVGDLEVDYGRYVNGLYKHLRKSQQFNQIFFKSSLINLNIVRMMARNLLNIFLYN